MIRCVMLQCSGEGLFNDDRKAAGRPTINVTKWVLVS